MNPADFKPATVGFQRHVDIQGIRYDSTTPAEDLEVQVEGGWLHIMTAAQIVSLPQSAISWVKWQD